MDDLWTQIEITISLRDGGTRTVQALGTTLTPKYVVTHFDHRIDVSDRSTGTRINPHPFPTIFHAMTYVRTLAVLGDVPTKEQSVALWCLATTP